MLRMLTGIILMGLTMTASVAAQTQVRPSPSGPLPTGPSPQGSALHVAVLEMDDFVAVGSANEGAAGLYRHEGDTTWSHHGWGNTRNFGLAAVPTDADIILLACGNGVLRTLDGGATWKVTTGWRVTEVLDVVVDPNAPNHVYIASAYGIWRSSDLGDSWDQMNRGIPTPEATFTPTLAMDRRYAGHLVAGSEEGLFRTTNGALEWSAVGPRGVAIRDVVQSLADPDLWLAGTEDHGVLISRDGGKSWTFDETARTLGNVYAIAPHPTDANHIAAAGYAGRVHRTTDGGRTWRVVGTVEHPVHALAFEPGSSQRLWAGTMGDGVYYSDDAGAQWQPGGLSGAVVWNMAFFSAPSTGDEGANDE